MNACGITKRIVDFSSCLVGHIRGGLAHVTIVAEMLMGGIGLGGSMIHAQRFADSPGVFAGIVEIGLSGFLVIWAVRAIRARLLVWHQETARK